MQYVIACMTVGVPHDTENWSRGRPGNEARLSPRVRVCVHDFLSARSAGLAPYSSGITSSVRFILCRSRRRHQYLDTVVDSVLI